MNDVKGVLMLVLALVFALFAWRVQSKLAKVDKLETDNATLTGQVVELTRQQDAYDAAVLAKAKEEQRTRDIRINIDHQLNEAARNESDPDASRFLSSPIPDGVRDAYRKGLDPAGSVGAGGG